MQKVVVARRKRRMHPEVLEKGPPCRGEVRYAFGLKGDEEFDEFRGNKGVPSPGLEIQLAEYKSFRKLWGGGGGGWCFLGVVGGGGGGGGGNHKS